MDDSDDLLDLLTYECPLTGRKRTAGFTDIVIDKVEKLLGCIPKQVSINAVTAKYFIKSCLVFVVVIDQDCPKP